MLQVLIVRRDKSSSFKELTDQLEDRLVQKNLSNSHSMLKKPLKKLKRRSFKRNFKSRIRLKTLHHNFMREYFSKLFNSKGRSSSKSI
jgi:hypothetical protein